MCDPASLQVSCCIGRGVGLISFLESRANVGLIIVSPVVKAVSQAMGYANRIKNGFITLKTISKMDTHSSLFSYDCWIYFVLLLRLWEQSATGFGAGQVWGRLSHREAYLVNDAVSLVLFFARLLLEHLSNPKSRRNTKAVLIVREQ